MIYESVTPVLTQVISTVAVEPAGKLALAGMDDVRSKVCVDAQGFCALDDFSRIKRYARLLAVARMRVSALSFKTNEYSW